MGFSKHLWAGTITKKTESGCSSCLQSLSCKSPARHARHCSADGEMLEIPSKALRAANSPACCPWRGLDKRVNWYSVAMDNRSRHLSIVASTWMETCTFPCQSHVVPDLVIFWFCVCVCAAQWSTSMIDCTNLIVVGVQSWVWQQLQDKTDSGIRTSSKCMILANLSGNPGRNEIAKLLLNKQSGVTPAMIASSRPAMWPGNQKWKGSRKGSSLSWYMSAAENALQVQIQVVWYL